MTRFMMTIDDSLDLVLYAFEHGEPGDLFVQKTPAATIETLVKVLKKLYKSNNTIEIIGTRHGEKLYETLLTREERARAQDLGEYYRVPADVRDLNYNLYYTKGAPKTSQIEDYHSHNTRRLDEDEMTKLLLKLNFIRKDIGLNSLGNELIEF